MHSNQHIKEFLKKMMRNQKLDIVYVKTDLYVILSQMELSYKPHAS